MCTSSSMDLLMFVPEQVALGMRAVDTVNSFMDALTSLENAFTAI